MASRAETPARELSSINFTSMLGGPLMAVVNAQAQAAMTTVNFIKNVGFMPKTSGGLPLDGTDASEPIYVSFEYPKEVAPYQPRIDPSITAIRVTTQGAGYTSVPDVTIADPPTGDGNRTATATANVVDGQVVSITLDDPGSGYTTAPAVTVAPPAGQGVTPAAAETVFDEGEDERPARFQQMELRVPILTILPVPYIRVEEATIDFNAKINSVEEAETSSVFKGDFTLTSKTNLEAGAAVPVKMVKVLGKVNSSVEMKVSASYQRNTTSGYKVDRTYSMAVHIRALQDEMPAGLERILGILEDNIISQPTGATAQPA